MNRTVLLLLLTLACGDTKDDDTESDDTAADTGEYELEDDVDDDDEPLSGEELYAMHCASCHGATAEGTDDGPGLGHEVERHSDSDLVRVILDGDDDMPAIGVTEDEAQRIVDYLRELFPS
jgi:mono/diheme cytochrome c family protein